MILKLRTTLKNLFMKDSKKNKKYVFLGDLDSINAEIIIKSHNYLKDKIKYTVIGNMSEFIDYAKKLKSSIKVNQILDPINFNNYNKNKINFFDVENLYKEKYENLLFQLNLSNKLSNDTKYDLVTMPIDKSIFKKKIKFIGMTEYLGEMNKCKTIMLMFGENFSVVPLTTHINLKDIYKDLIRIKIKKNLSLILKSLKSKKYNLNFKNLKFLCYNPHCSEDSTLGKEDELIKNILRKNFKQIKGPYPADSAFNNFKKDTLFISTYHDQALIPYKILNKKGYNLTLGLSYKRLSPAHGTAKDIKFKNKCSNLSYIECMLS